MAYISCDQSSSSSRRYLQQQVCWHIHSFFLHVCPVGWSCKIHRLHLCRGVRPPLQWVSRIYDTKSDGEVPAMLELWERQRTLSLSLLPGPLWPRVVAPDRVLSMGQIELNCVLMLNWITWNRTLRWTCSKIRFGNSRFTSLNRALTLEVTKNICHMWGEYAVYHSTVTRLFENFCTGCKNINHQVRLG